MVSFRKNILQQIESIDAGRILRSGIYRLITIKSPMSPYYFLSKVKKVFWYV